MIEVRRNAVPVLVRDLFVAGMVLVTVPMAAQAGGWDEFQARCVDSFENMSLPIVEGLVEMPPVGDEAGYVLGDDAALVLELAPDDGEMACRLEDRSGQAGSAFDSWMAEGVRTERYEEVGEDSWQSYEWVEPVVAVQKRRDGDTVILRILVTDLES